jgi:hypothetical protein
MNSHKNQLVELSAGLAGCGICKVLRHFVQYVLRCNPAGVKKLEVLRGDHGGTTSYDAAVSATGVPESATLALLKTLALGQVQVAAGRVRPVAEVVDRIRKRRPTVK